MIEIARFADVYEAEIVAARLQALGWVRLSVPDGEEITARARLAALRGGAEAIAVEAEPGSGRVPDRTLPAKLTLGAILLAFLAGR